MLIKKLRTVASMLVRNPEGLKSLLFNKYRNRQKLRDLRRMLCSNTGDAVWSKCGLIMLPFHDDGDLQELFYQIDGDQWWQHEYELLKDYVHDGNVVVDVGANIGFITGVLSMMVGAEGCVHSFEPSPTVFAKLEKVVKKNSLSNVVVHNLGCGDEPNELLLASPTGSSGNATLTSGGSGLNVQNVKVLPLDVCLLPHLDRLDFIKIDTEGFEDRVLIGAAQLVERFKPVFYIELSQEYRKSSLAAIHWLKSRGYHFPVDPDPDKSHNGDNFIAVHHG